MGYLKNLLISIDQLGNSLGAGDPDETISSRVGRAARAGKRWGKMLQVLIDAMFGAGHCQRAIERLECKEN